jgi:membrane associated rhomboid family serine protease
MGIYDRDYYRQTRPSRSLPGPRTVVGTLILVNAVVYLVDWGLLEGRLSEYCWATVGTLTHPLDWWQFITYGFLHAKSPGHIIANMLGLYFLGRDIEELYGSREFLRLYLALVAFGGVAWAAAERLHGAPLDLPVVGASGAVVGIVVLYALNFPKRMLLLYFVLPVPAWFVGVLCVAYDAYGAISQPKGDFTAFTVHLGGAALALLYYGMGWNFGRWMPRASMFSLRWLRPRPKFRVHTPDDDPDSPADGEEKNLSEEVDRILEKISREGEASLTRKERRILETASRQYQKRRQDSNDRVR